MSKQQCINNLHPTRHLKHLPLRYRCSGGLKTLLVAYAAVDQLDACQKMIDEAASRGDNVGIDEFTAGEQRTNMLFHLSDIFLASDEVSGQIEAFMFIQFCLFQRSVDSCTATIHVIRSANIDDVTYAELATLASEFAKQIEVGYTQCLTQVALCFSDLHLELRRQGFFTVAVLPDWVEIAGVGVRENAVMIKQLGLPDRPIKSKEEVTSMTNSVLEGSDVLNEYHSLDLPQIPNLPLTRTSTSGRRIVLRHATKEEDAIIYEMLQDAIEKGDGFSVHEIPTFDYFRAVFRAHSYAAMVEDEATKSIVGFFVVQDAAQYRRSKTDVSEGTIILTKEFRGLGLSRLIHDMGIIAATSVGYKRELRTALINNQPILRSWRWTKSPIVGVIPRGAYQRAVGWVDLAMTVLDYKTGLLSEQPDKPRSSNKMDQPAKL